MKRLRAGRVVKNLVESFEKKFLNYVVKIQSLYLAIHISNFQIFEKKIVQLVYK